MEPTLVAGQGLVGLRTRTASVGELRCIEHPDHAGFWLVKRVEDVDQTTMRVVSDNASLPTVDSRSFGPVPIRGSYRVVLRIPSRWM